MKVLEEQNPTWTYGSEASGWVFYQDSLPPETGRIKPAINLNINKVPSRWILLHFQWNKFSFENTGFQNKYFFKIVHSKGDGKRKSIISLNLPFFLKIQM